MHMLAKVIADRGLLLISAAAVGLLGAAIAWSAAAPWTTIVLAAAGGIVIGGIAGQGAAWARAGAGSGRRQELALLRAIDTTERESRRTRDDLGQRLRMGLAEITEAQRQSLRVVADSTAKVREEVVAEHRTTRRYLDDQVALLEAYVQLQRLIPLQYPMPRAGTWAASEDLLLWLAGEVMRTQPRLVVDLGSGQSSVWMAAAMRQAAIPGRVLAIDHEQSYAEATRRLGATQGVSQWLEVRHAPLVAITIEDRVGQWYDPAVFEDIEGINLLCVDGPPGAGSDQARWPALPVLHQRLAPGARVVLDDLIRRDEKDILSDWCERWSDLGLEELDFEKGAAVLTLPDLTDTAP
jgi:predicted O-methyltransferase YrrM